MIAVAHCTTKDEFWPVMVTASVDRISIAEDALFDRDITLCGSIVWTGRSSLQIAMRCDIAPMCNGDNRANNCDAGRQPMAADGGPGLLPAWLEARFTFVARSRGTGVSTPVPQLVVESVVQEQEFQRVQRVMDRKHLLRKSGPVSEAQQGPGQAQAKVLLAEGELLRAMPCRAGAEAVLIRDTAMSSMILCMPQERNTANR
jgi:acyl-coenzyme A thioesterase 9